VALETVAPSAGLVKAALSVVEPPFCTVTVTLAEPVRVELCTVAVRVWSPSGVMVVSQGKVTCVLEDDVFQTVVPAAVNV
jgi:hypothetical protein